MSSEDAERGKRHDKLQLKRMEFAHRERLSEIQYGAWSALVKARDQISKLEAVATAARNLLENYGGEARDQDLDALAVALERLKNDP